MRVRKHANVVAIGLLIAVIPVLGQTVISPPAQSFVLRFFGDQIVQVPAGSPLNLGSSFTMECWVYLESASARSILMGKTTNAPYGDPNFQYVLGFADSTHPQFVESTGQPGSARIAGSQTYVPLRKWTHLAATLTGNLMRLYVNGDSVGATTCLGPPPMDDVTRFALGAGFYQNGTISGYTGAMCQARVWNRARSSGELMAGAGSFLTGNEDGLTASWPLDDGGGQSARDQKQTFPLLMGISAVNRINDPHWVRKNTLETGPYFVLKESKDTSLNLNTGRFIDFNNDGKPDLIITQSDKYGNFSPMPLVLLKNDGIGTFSNVTSQMLGSKPPTTVVAVGYAAVDVNNDGLKDFIIGDEGEDRSPWSGAQIRLLVQKPGGVIADETSLRLPLQNDRCSSLAVGDINGDGFVDFYVANGGMSPTSPHFLINDGTGKFYKDTTRLPSSFLNYYSPTATLVDVDGDGDIDLILTKAQADGPDLVLLNDGTGHFTQGSAGSLPPEPLGSGDRPRSYNAMQVADFNHDGSPDLIAPAAIFGYGTESMLWYIQNNRNGTYSDVSDQIPQHWLPEDDALGAPVVADFNNDGFMDILVPGSWYRTPPQLYLNKGDGSFIDCTDLIPSDKKYYAVVAGDIDGDGKTDIVMWAGGDFAVVRNLKFFDVTTLAKPTISTLTPSQGIVGTVVTIQGTNLAGTNDVQFNGKSTSFQFVSESQITALVPAGASTGTVQVNTASGIARSQSNFVVPLIIYGFSPTSGIAGQRVLISGSNFTGTTLVRFGSVASPSFTVVADSQISAIVPLAAPSGAISVTTANGTFSTSTSFTVIRPPDQRHSLRFAGNQVAVAPYSTLLNLGARFTMEAWIYVESGVLSTCSIMGKVNDPVANDPYILYGLQFSGDAKKLEFAQSTGQPGSYRIATSPTDCPLRSWTHVAATFDSSMMRLYVNGAQVSSQASQGVPTNNTIRFSVGAGLDRNGLIATRGLSGALRQVRVWNRALTAQEIQNKSVQYISENDSGLVCFWPLDDSVGQVARDLGPHKLSLTLGTTSGTDAGDPSWVQTTSLVSVENQNSLLPSAFQLDQNYPNPFNPSTTIRYSVPLRSRVRIQVYNVLGQLVDEIVNKEIGTGYYEGVWKANVSSGVYIYRMEAFSLENPDMRFTDVKKMILLR